MEEISRQFVALVLEYGYEGMAASLFLINIGVPLPSELILGLSGLAAQRGSLGLMQVLVLATVVQMAGFMFSYWLTCRWLGDEGRLFGKKSAVRLRRLHELTRRNGSMMVFAGIFVPGLHGLAGYAAGFIRMGVARFAALALAGSAAWTIIFVFLGYLAGDYMHDILHVMHKFGFLMLGVVGLCLIIWYSRHHRRTLSRDN